MNDDEWWMYEYFQRTKAEIPGLSWRNQACKDKTVNHGIVTQSGEEAGIVSSEPNEENMWKFTWTQ